MSRARSDHRITGGELGFSAQRAGRHEISPLLRLQQVAGNAAVRTLIEDRATAHGADGLTAPELSGVEFDDAYHDAPPLRVDDPRVEAVRTLQTLLADTFGQLAAMPRTFRTGSADGVWGDETTAAVRAFQEQHGVTPVGGWEAGHKTLGAMDRTLGARPGPRPAPPATKVALELRPPVGPEAGPRQQLGDQAYEIEVVGTGFAPRTPLLLDFDGDSPRHVVAGEDGSFHRTIEAARRSRGTYTVTARGVTAEARTDFRVMPPDDPEVDPRREKAYAFFLRQATRMLRDASFGTPLSSDFEHDQFDTEYWQWTDDQLYNRVLELRPGKTPAAAIDALFARLTDWRVDCDHTVQLANLYAMRMVLGRELFNHREGLQMVLRPRESSGLTTRLHYGRTDPRSGWRIVHTFTPPDSFEFATGATLSITTSELVAQAPVGSRVRWTNTRAPSDSAFHHENAVKLAADLFAAAGIDDPVTGNEFTREQLETRLALMTAPAPTRAEIDRTIYIDEIEVFDRP